MSNQDDAHQVEGSRQQVEDSRQQVEDSRRQVEDSRRQVDEIRGSGGGFSLMARGPSVAPYLLAAALAIVLTVFVVRGFANLQASVDRQTANLAAMAGTGGQRSAEHDGMFRAIHDLTVQMQLQNYIAAQQLPPARRPNVQPPEGYDRLGKAPRTAQ